MNQIVTPLPGTLIDPRYPESDGKVVGETDYHFIGLTTLHDTLADLYASRNDVYIGSNLNFYWKLGDPQGSPRSRRAGGQSRARSKRRDAAPAAYFVRGSLTANFVRGSLTR